MASTLNASTSGGGGIIATADASGVMGLQTAGTTAVTIDASQNVGIGTSSPTYKLQMSGGNVAFSNTSGNVCNVEIAGNGNTPGTNSFVIQQATTSDTLLWNRANANLTFGTNATERMRIDSSGNVLINTTTALGGLTVATSIAPAATPSSLWGIDFAPTTGVPTYATLASGATYDIATGSGLVVIHSNSNGSAALFLCYAGVVAKLGGGADIVATTGGASQIGIIYNSGAGKYRINNGYATSQSLFITTIRTRTAS